MIPYIVGGSFAAALIGLIILTWHLTDIPDKPAGRHAVAPSSSRPGGDEQWRAFHGTVPNIRAAALAEAERERKARADEALELAFFPRSIGVLDLPGPPEPEHAGRHRRPDDMELVPAMHHNTEEIYQ